MLQRIKRTGQRYHFNWIARKILDTPPLHPYADDPVIVSMVCHNDALMYLLAIKTFYKRLRRGRIVLINDGTLTRRDLDLLRYHVSPSEIVRADSLRSSHCPSYISWKKLLCIANIVKDNYAIQLDSDTLTVGDNLPEVTHCVESGTSYILSTWANQTVGTMAEAVTAARSSASQHVQTVAERNFAQLPDHASLKYVRGCSGFDGFAKGLFDLRQLEEFSRQMFEIIGDKWGEWGSEQTMSNVLVANSERSMALPYPKYYNYWGTVKPASFIHFVGTYRYSSGVYVREAKRALAGLLEGLPV